MTKDSYLDAIKETITTLNLNGISKAKEIVISEFSNNKAIIGKERFQVFNSNDYLGLRFHPKVLEAHHKFANKYGAGSGSVRFISGTTREHKELESKLANFHGREDAIVFTSAFSANLGVLSALINPPKNSEISAKVCVLSDELNHKSIIDGIKISGLDSKHKYVYSHLDYSDLERLITEKIDLYDRVIVVSDGIFSMLGESADVAKLKSICDRFSNEFSQGVLLIVDDSHGVGVYGETGRGCEEVYNAMADVLVGTLGKAFGVEGGYVVGKSEVIEYLRETASTYIYSNSLAPASAGAALEALSIVASEESSLLHNRVNQNIKYLKEKLQHLSLQFRYDSNHPIQPLNIGDTTKTKKFADYLFKHNIIVTPIIFPVVPKDKDEIRLQLSALHDPNAIDDFCVATAAFLKI